MITINIYRDNSGNIIAYDVSGHAGAAAAGHDIVCAAVSALSQAPILGLEHYLKLKPQYTVNEESGVFTLKLGSEPDAGTQAILETMYFALQSIERQFPQYVKVKAIRR